MISSKFSNITPNFKIGFPFEMYYQFKIKAQCDESTLLHGANLCNTVYNYIICFLVIALVNYKLKTTNKKQKT